jgi:TonB family protein
MLSSRDDETSHMFGPALSIHARSRIYRRRLAGAHLVAAALLSAALLVVRYEPDPYTPPRVGYLGAPLIVEHIDEVREEVSDRELRAGGHPLPEAIQAVELDVELTHAAPDISIEERKGEADREIPEVEEPRVGPVEEEHLATRDAAPLSVRSREIVVLKFVKPPYPADARLLGIEGVVTIRALVGADGEVEETVTEADDDILPSCVNAARLAASKWRFAPLLEAGEARPFWVEIPFRFRLDGRVEAGT